MRRYNVLVIDDDHDIADLVVTVFKKAGYEAAAVSSGKKALKQIKEKTPDIIILDLFMREMDGMEICRKLKADKKTAHIPIIMLTVESSEEDKVKAFELGVDDYVQKPFNTKELVLRAKQVLKRSSGLQCVQRNGKVKNILITGGAGFIGSHLARALVKKNYNIHIIDDFSTGRLENIEDLLKNKLVKLTTGSITDEIILSKAIEEADLIYHLAATVGVKNVVNKSLDTIIYDTLGTMLVLKYASSSGVKVLMTSTSEVYGKNRVIPFQEEHDITLGSPYINRWSYACSKLLDEFLAIAYFRDRGLPVVIVRLFNVVGPRQVGHYGMVVPRFFKSAYSGEPLHVYGDGKQRRCFTYVDDAVDLIIRLANAPKAEGQIVNLGSAHEVTISELARKVKRATHSHSEIAYQEYKQYYGENFQDIRRRAPDVAKLKGIVGKAPKRTIDEIIKKMKHYYDQHPEELARM